MDGHTWILPISQTVIGAPLDQTDYVWPVITKAIAVLAILVGTLLVITKYRRMLLSGSNNQGREDLIEVVAMRRLEPRRNLYLVQIKNRRVLVATSEQGIAALFDCSNQSAADDCAAADVSAVPTRVALDLTKQQSADPVLNLTPCRLTGTGA